jgi:CRP/FNR family cyclic AMP-dependent transcriptional regulator
VAEPPSSLGVASWLWRTLRSEDFETLAFDDLEVLRGFSVAETHPSGTILFRQGDAPGAVFIIEKGDVELAYETRLGRRVVATVRSRSCIGDCSVMLETPHPYSAVTRGWATTLRLNLEAMQLLLELHPDICFRWLRLVSRRIARVQRQVAELAGRPASEQVVRFLLDEAEEHQSPIVELTQTELAEGLALSRQTLSRVLGQLERQGIIVRGHRRVEIRDLDRLRRQLWD